MYQWKRKGFTLVELLVVIAIIGTMVGMLLPAVQSAREASRQSNCKANLTQLHKAMQLYEESNEKLPGYVEPLGMKSVGSKDVSWVVMLLPYLDQPALWESWSKPTSASGDTPGLAIVMCPSDPPDFEDFPALSYVVNAGNIANEPDDICNDISEKPGNGMFYDRTRGLNDQRDLAPQCMGQKTDPVIQVSFAHVKDGLTQTLMMSESLRTVTWGSSASEIDRKWHYGFCWGQPGTIQQGILDNSVNQFARINGIRESSQYSLLSEMNSTDAFPSSHHPGGVNVAFAGGNVTSLNENLDFLVYAQLMTINRKTAELHIGDSLDQTFDRDLEQPSDSDY